MKSYLISDRKQESYQYFHNNVNIIQNLFIINSKFEYIYINDCTINGDVFILNNITNVSFSGSKIKGNIYIIDSENTYLNFSRINNNKIEDNEYIELDLILNNSSKNIDYNNSNFEIKDSSEELIILNKCKKVLADNIFDNSTRQSILIKSSTISLNLESSVINNFTFKGGSILPGTFSMVKLTCQGTFLVNGVGIAGDIAAQKACFGKDFIFNDIRFDNEIHFKRAVFLGKATFSDCTFYQEVYFQQATFTKNVIFSQAIFQSKLSLKDIQYSDKDNKIIFHDGSAFFGYVDLRSNNFNINTFSFKTVRGLRNIFYSIVNDENSEAFVNSINLYKPSNVDIPSNDKTPLDIYLNNRRVELFNEARKAMEDISKDNIATEFHILCMDEIKERAKIEYISLYENRFGSLKNLKIFIIKYINYFKYVTLKKTTNYGEKIEGLIRFIFLDWLFFGVFYSLLFYLYGIQEFVNSVNHNYFHGILPNENSSNLKLYFSSGLIHSYNNLLSLNTQFICSCHKTLMFITLMQGLVNLIIFALMVQMVIKKLEIK